MKRELCMLVLSAVLLTGTMLVGCKSEITENSGEKAESAQEMEAAKETDGREAATVSEEAVFGGFASETLSGTAVTQDIFGEADLTMVNIWGTFCGPCIRELPELGELSREYEGTGVQIIGMLCDVYEAGDETALEIIEETDADYPHIVASQDLEGGFLGRVQAVPTTVFVDSAGRQVGEAYAGARDKESWKEIIEALRGGEDGNE